MFEELCSSCSVFHVAADDVLIRPDPVAVKSLEPTTYVQSRTHEAGTGNLRPSLDPPKLEPVTYIRFRTHEAGTENLRLS